jgi:hypothetical protein
MGPGHNADRYRGAIAAVSSKTGTTLETQPLKPALTFVTGVIVLALLCASASCAAATSPRIDPNGLTVHFDSSYRIQIDTASR